MPLSYNYNLPPNKKGFTLIELSIVLVIIALIIGGVIMGTELIVAAKTRSVISQFNKYKSAVNTFRIKYNGVPGDITPEQAAELGMATRPGGPVNGDGNGKVESTSGSPSVYLSGETVFFWNDLSKAKLIGGSFEQTTASTASSNFSLYMPESKIGRGHVLAFENSKEYFGVNPRGMPQYTGLVFEMAQVAQAFGGGQIGPGPIFTTVEAYNIDIKIDDGMPESGKVVVGYTGSKSSTTHGWGRNVNQGVGYTGSTDNYCISDSVVPGIYNIVFPDSISCNLMFAGQ